MNHDSSAQPSDTGRDTAPWYRQFWPWFIIALPLSAVIAGTITLVIAYRNADDVVVDNYYQEGRAINRDLDEERLARRLGLRAQLSQHDGALSVQMLSKAPLPWPDTLSLTLRHPTQAIKDKQFVLKRASDQGLYRSKAPHLDGDWYVTLSDSRWRMEQRLAIGETPVTLESAL